MSLKKRVLKHDYTQRAVAWLLAQYIYFVYLTSRKRCIVDDDAIPYLQGERNAIFAFWHGRMMICPCFEPPKRKMHVLISLHRDGILISRVIAHFGEATIAGSSSKGGTDKGGAAALKEIMRVLKNGDNVSITPDGPRGPVQEAQMGVIAAARLSGKPILPVTFSSTRRRHLKSWDRFMLALPFGRIAFCVGKPILVARGIAEPEQEQARLMFEQTMNQLVATADALTAQGAPHA